MKKIDVSRLERLRSANLRIGFAASLLLILLAFSWTSERPGTASYYDNFATVKDLEIIPPTAHPKQKSPPPPKVLPTKFELQAEPVSFTPIEPVIAQPEPGPVTEPVGYQPRRTVVPPPAPPAPRPAEPEGIWKVVQDMPRFPGCEQEGFSKKEKAVCAENKLLQFLADNLRYPAIARENGVEGLVVVRFVVETDGSISNAEVVRDIGAGCGAEALRVAQSMPNWIPGMQQGRKVRVQYNLPVRFSLQ